ncbi:conserved hypothetical protein [Ricinus communis]|uniref:Uncharacterized protein n=1 Tax=Ricinus communis TaxID=3988 RepID=B9S4Z3_RICCO|nr:conserved hypothetical protein [Ricinus communis]
MSKKGLAKQSKAQAMIIYRSRPNYWTPYNMKTDQIHHVKKCDHQLTVGEMEGDGLESPMLNSGIHMRHINDIGLDGKEVSEAQVTNILLNIVRITVIKVVNNTSIPSMVQLYERLYM